MRMPVFLLKDAEDDIYDICTFAAISNSPERADKLFKSLRKTCESLADFPLKGHVPPELERVTVFEYREVRCTSYRIIYRLRNESVFIHCVLDSRRNIQEILHRRLLR
ncbi:MAG: type II toxin-antitoxin system RelE/ParE family toxin [Candidatus Fermentibacteraceae bacterium]|nr:type II toxin-antitoxin system RelE/ParE family toxin [Candidatus Fermentibacteraceae bacterium]